MNYKIVYYQGDRIDSSTEVKSGSCILTDTDLQIVGNESISVKFANLIEIDLVRLHGLGRVLRIRHKDGMIFLSVIRFKLFRLPLIGQFATINFFRTGQLFAILQSKVPNATIIS